MQDLSQLLEAAASEIDAATNLAALDAVRVSYLGKKGELTSRLKSLSALPADERPAAGQAINKAKQSLQQALSAIAQQPDEAGTITRTLFVGLAMVESTAIYCFVVAMILIFANPFWNRVVELLGG